MKNNLKLKSTVLTFIPFALLFVLAIIFVVPLIWVFLTSLKLDAEINQAGGFLVIPETWTLKNFFTLLDPLNKNIPIYTWLLNSFFVSGIHCILAITIYTMSAYAYAKMNFKGKNIIFLSMLFISSFPAVVNIIPLYKIMLTLGWLNTPLALIVPGLAGMFNIFLIRQFMYGIPSALLEAAKIDGANEARIFIQLIVPLSKPIIIAVALFTFTGNWNDFLWPSIAINNVDRLTLTAGLRILQGYVHEPALIATGAVIAIIPMIILFLITQKYFVRGISISSGVKG